MYYYIFSGHEYDKYGFVKHFIEEDHEEELDPLVVTATMCERQSEELDNKIEVYLQITI